MDNWQDTTDAFASNSVMHVVQRLERGTCHHSTTTRLYGIGKGAALRKVREDNGFLKCMEVLCDQSGSKDAISSAGEKALVYLYGGKRNDTLDGLRKTVLQQGGKKFNYR